MHAVKKAKGGYEQLWHSAARACVIDDGDPLKIEVLPDATLRVLAAMGKYANEGGTNGHVRAIGRENGANIRGGWYGS